MLTIFACIFGQEQATEVRFAAKEFLWINEFFSLIKNLEFEIFNFSWKSLVVYGNMHFNGETDAVDLELYKFLVEKIIQMHHEPR